MAIQSTQGQQLVDEWIIRTGEAVKNVDQLAASIRKQQAHERKLDLIRSELSNQTSALQRANQSLTRSMNEAASGFVSGIVKGQLLTNGIMALGSSFLEASRNAEKLSQAAKIYTGDINKARAATKGHATDLDLMLIKNRLATLGVKMTDEAFNNMLANLTKISTALGNDMRYSLESATTMLARQSSAVADNVGVVLKAEEAYEKWADSHGILVKDMTVAQKKIAFQTEALEQLRVKASELPDALDTVGGEVKSLSVEWQNFTTELAATLGESEALRDFLHGTAGLVRSIAYEVENLTNKISDFLAGVDRAAIERGKLMGSDEAIRKKIDRQASEAFSRDFSMQGPVPPGGDIGSNPLAAITVLGTSSEGTGKKKIKVKKQRAKKEKTETASDIFDRLTGEDPGEIRQEAQVILDEIGRIEDAQARLSSQPNAIAEAAGKISTMTEPIRAATKQTLEFNAALADLGPEIMGYFKQAIDAAGNFRTEMDGSKEAMWGMESASRSAAMQFGSSIFSALDQAITGSESFGVIALKMLKTVTLGLASDLMARSIHALIIGQTLATSPFTVAAAPFWLGQAAQYAVGASVVGGLGLLASKGVSTASGTGGGGSSATPVKRTSYPVSSSVSSPQSPSFSRPKEDDERPQIIQVYFGDPGSPTATMIAQRRADAHADATVLSKYSER